MEKTKKIFLTHKRKNPDKSNNKPIKENSEKKPHHHHHRYHSPVTKITLKTKRPNRKKLLKNKIEFFLSDINLYHDTYLKKIYFSENCGVNPEVFLSFNSIKELLCDIKNKDDKINVIIKSIEISNKLYYDNATNKIKRIYSFEEKNIDINSYDDRTLYIGKLPKITNHKLIYDIFEDYKILYISLLKKNKKFSGEALVTFNNKEDLPVIIKRYNNIVPEKISRLKIEPLESLVIMTKNEYLAKNKKAKDSKKNITIKNDIKIPLDKNVCLKLFDVKKEIELKKIKKIFGKFCKDHMPIFIDLDRNTGIMILRFDSKDNLDFFIEKIKENKNNLKDIMENCNNEFKFKELEKEEKNKYLEFVKKEVENFQNKKKLKKINNIRNILNKKAKENLEDKADNIKKILDINSDIFKEKCNKEAKNYVGTKKSERSDEIKKTNDVDIDNEESLDLIENN